jgi:hypothetical protein
MVAIVSRLRMLTFASNQETPSCPVAALTTMTLTL